MPARERAREETMKKMLLVGWFGLSLGMAGTAFAKKPVTNVGARHPNLAAAQRLIEQAHDRITAAQKANEFDFGGHAAKAKDLLEQAAREIKEAAETANEKR
jgi:hypothetical protein